MLEAEQHGRDKITVVLQGMVSGQVVLVGVARCFPLRV